jgi:hypothetical protein
MKKKKSVLMDMMPPMSAAVMQPQGNVFSDNNPDGKVKKPGDYTDPANYTGRKKICFASWIAPGESPMKPDVNVVVASGTHNSRGQGSNRNYVWADDAISGRWNDADGEWGGNMTGF